MRRSSLPLALTAAGIAALLLAPSALAQLSFSSPSAIDGGDAPRSVRIGDFNRDGDPDVVTAFSGLGTAGSRAGVMLGGSGATFPGGGGMSVDRPYTTAAGDFNGDGDMDLAAATPNSATASIALGADETVPSSCSSPVCFQSTATTAVGGQSFVVRVGDFNGDGDPDLVLSRNALDDVVVLLGGTGGTFSAPTDYDVGDDPHGLLVEDFNGDSDPDVAVTNIGSDDLSILLGGPGGTFGAATSIDLPGEEFGSTEALASGDFNGDSDPDLAVVLGSGVAVMLGGAGSTFGAPTKYSATTAAVAVGEFNGDGDPDLAITDLAADAVTVRLGGAGGGFGPPTDFPATTDPVSVAPADLDADGDDDLVVAGPPVLGGGTAVIVNTTPPPPDDDPKEGDPDPTAPEAQTPAPPPPPAPSGSGDGGGGLISASGCLNTDATLSGTQLGPARLGRKLAKQRTIFRGANTQTRANLDRYCAEGGGNFRIGYPTPRLSRTLSRSLARKVAGRVVIVLTSSKRFSLGGIEVGDTVAEARSNLSREKAFKVGSNTWYVAKRGNARLLVKAKGGRVGEIGIGDPRLSTTVKATKRFLNAWKLG